MKKKLLFVYNHQFPTLWKDGLYAALEELKSYFEIEKCNLATLDSLPTFEGDFILGWGGFNSKVDQLLQSTKQHDPSRKIGLCIAGNAFPAVGMENYDCLFYETEWVRNFLHLDTHPHLISAFGVNTNIMTPWPEAPVIWDYLSVGAFAYWKRHDKILDKPGTKLVVGEIQKDNWAESFDIISNLLLGGVAVSDMLYPTKLRNIYNCSGKVYIPADTMGGGERAVWEAKACNRPVIIEDDNPKLRELVDAPMRDHIYYANQLRRGILEVLDA